MSCGLYVHVGVVLPFPCAPRSGLDLDFGDQLVGTIPSSIGDLVSLTTLELGHNQLTGTVPASISTLVNLTCAPRPRCVLFCA